MVTTRKEAETQTPVSLTPRSGHTVVCFLREVLLPYLGTRLMLVLIGLGAIFYLLPLLKSDPILPSVQATLRFPDVLWLMWRHFDSGFYVDIAMHGYWPASTLNMASNWIFHPLYPMLIVPFGRLFGGSDAAFNVAALVVSNVAALVAIVYLYLLVRRDFNAQIASRTVMYLALFPTSFYLSAIFSEAVFLACATACVYYGRERRWWIAGLCGGLASLTRVQGLVLFVPIAWEYWQVLSERYAPLPEMSEASLLEKGYNWLQSRLRALLLAGRQLRNWFSLLAVALIPLGLVPFLVYSYLQTGDFLATIHNHSVGWDRQFQYPWRLLLHALIHPLPPNAMEWDFWLLNIVYVFVFLGFTVWAFRRLPMIYSLYTLVMVLMPLMTGSLKSISRYYLLVFPVCILLALWSSQTNGSRRSFVITNVFTSMQILFMVFFVLGLPLIA
jgi:hypothetical protein